MPTFSALLSNPRKKKRCHCSTAFVGHLPYLPGSCSAINDHLQGPYCSTNSHILSSSWLIIQVTAIHGLECISHLFRPGSFDQLRVDYFRPSVQALHFCFSINFRSNSFPTSFGQTLLQRLPELCPGHHINVNHYLQQFAMQSYYLTSSWLQLTTALSVFRFPRLRLPSLPSFFLFISPLPQCNTREESE